MARNVVWSEGANADLHEIETYVAARSPSGARRVIESLRQIAEGLGDFPYAARMIPEFEDSHRRETFVYEYRLMYRVEPSCVRILRVVHGRRLLTNVHGSFQESPQQEYTAAYGSQMMPASGVASPFSTVR